MYDSIGIAKRLVELHTGALIVRRRDLLNYHLLLLKTIQALFEIRFNQKSVQSCHITNAAVSLGLVNKGL